MKASVFSPTVTVFDDGRITIDFVDSYDHTYDTEDGRYWHEPSRDWGESHVALLDAVLGDSKYEPRRLRRLAEYIRVWASRDERKNLDRVRLALREIGEPVPAPWAEGVRAG